MANTKLKLEKFEQQAGKLDTSLLNGWAPIAVGIAEIHALTDQNEAFQRQNDGPLQAVGQKLAAAREFHVQHLVTQTKQCFTTVCGLNKIIGLRLFGDVVVI